MMTLQDFMLKEKMVVNGCEAQAYCVYDRVSVNGDIRQSPWRKVSPGDVIVLRQYDTERRKEGDVLVRTCEVGGTDGSS